MHSSRPVKASFVYLMFMVSGATALVYQVIWSRWLGLVFGNTTVSVSVVLAAFMMGLAAGSWGAGRILPRVSRPMRAYAFLEIGIGVFALCFPFLTRLTELIFTAAVSAETPAAVSLLVRTVLAFLLLLVPTTLMGATLPFLTEFFRRSPRHTRNWKVGLLYAANTLGAALGIFAAGFLLIELLGVSKTALVAAALNGGVAVIAFTLSSGEKPFPDEGTPATDASTDAMGRLAIGVLTASGAIALASEVLWTRTLESLVGNSTYAFSLIVLLYLVGIAAGSWLMSLLVKRLRDLPLWLASLQLAAGVWTFAAVSLFIGFGDWLSPYRGEVVPLSLLFWLYLKVMLLLLPLALFSGACFPLATRIIDPASADARGALIARAYAWNTIGAVGGSLAAGFLIAPFFEYLDALHLLAFLYALTAVVASAMLIRRVWREPGTRIAHVAAGVCAVVTAVLSLVAVMRADTFQDHFNRKYYPSRVLSHRPGLQGVTSVVRFAGSRFADRLLVNGLGMTKRATDVKMMAHLPMLVHPDPQDTLVICFGMGTTYRSAISHGGNVTAVELVGEVFDAFDYFYADAALARAYPRGRMVVNDGRNFLKLTRNAYDVITIDPPPPIDAAGVNHLYSREFMELARSRLKKGGVVAHWIPYPGTRSGVDDDATFQMLAQTFVDVFPYVYTIRGYHEVGMHMLGSLGPLDISPARLERRMKNQQVIADLRELDPVDLSYIRNIREQRLPNPTIDLITDDRPRLEFYLVRALRQGSGKLLPYNSW